MVAAGATYDPKAPSSATSWQPRARGSRGPAISSARRRPRRAAHDRRARPREAGAEAVSMSLMSSSPIIPFGQMLGPLAQGYRRCRHSSRSPAVRWRSSRARSTSLRPVREALCSKKCLLTFWVARADVDQNVAARFFRNAIHIGRRLGEPGQERFEASAKISREVNVPIAAAVLNEDGAYDVRDGLRTSPAQPWLRCLFAKRRLIPGGVQGDFELVK